MHSLQGDVLENYEWGGILILNIGRNELADSFQFEMALRLVPLNWRIQIMKKKSHKDKIRALCNKLLQLYGCSLLSGGIIKELKFGSVANGKPILSNQANISFSMSNGNDYVVMYAIRNKNEGIQEIGVDIASAGDLSDPPDLLLFKDIFHEDEYSYIEKFSDVEKQDLFAYYWSIKESYTKYTGTGLFCDLKEINVGSLDMFQDSQTMDKLIKDELISFSSYWIGPNHDEIITTCTKKIMHSTSINSNIYYLSINELVKYLQNAK